MSAGKLKAGPQESRSDRAVWAPGCPEVVREAGDGSRLSGTSRAARRPIQ